ncbi:caspase family protein [Spirillospora sp. NPDC047279]|uniref:caspase family protein n=1 Tax=Spirillospora sp. NPDC047279 TaxID=3155478 RepID=UPI0033D735B0
MGRTGQRRRALLVASDRYEAPDLSGLRSPAHDVEALASALSDPEIGAFSVTQVFNRPAHEVNAAIEDFFCEKRPDDVLLLYVSCHGVKDDGGRLYFATTNTRINRLGSTAVASTYVSEQMAHSMSRNIILLLDCCYSGAFVEGMVRRGGPGVGITERLQGSGRAVLSSSSALEYAFELDERHLTVSRAGGGRPSVFTAALVEGLTSGEADHNRDGRISVDELYDFTYARVTAANPHQTPTKYSDVSGELVVAYSPRTAEPPSLPEEVLSAVGHPLPSLRLAVIEALKGLAMGRGKTSTLAKEQLGVLLDDDSRSVAAKARDALDEIEGRGPARGRAWESRLDGERRAPSRRLPRCRRIRRGQPRCRRRRRSRRGRCGRGGWRRVRCGSRGPFRRPGRLRWGRRPPYRRPGHRSRTTGCGRRRCWCTSCRCSPACCSWSAGAGT